MKRWFLVLIGCALVVWAQGARAAAQVRLAAWKIVAESAQQESLQPLDKLLPGERVEYQATYDNPGALPARAVVLTLPIPAQGFVWQPAESRADAPAPTHASLDGERFEPVPLMRAEQLPDGRRVMRRVPAAEYRFLRWQLGDVPAGASRTVRARMQMVAPDAPRAR